MALRKIAVMGHPVLRKPAEAVPVGEIKSNAMRSLVKDMIDTMFDYDGRGLAAPQIHESRQIVVLIWDFEPKKKPSLLVLFNPILKSLTEETDTHWEGCLSVPGLRGKVTRPNKVSMEAYDENAKRISFTAEGFAATVLQHECDHLVGKLYLDRMTDLSQLVFNQEFSRYHAPDSDSDSEADETDGSVDE